MQLAVDSNRKTISYIKGILQNWEKADITSVLEAKQATEEFKQKSKKKNVEKQKNDGNIIKNSRNYNENDLKKLYANKEIPKEE